MILTGVLRRIYHGRSALFILILLMAGAASCPQVSREPGRVSPGGTSGTGGGRPTPTSNMVGTLRIEGPNVLVNRLPARDGESIRSGDHVATGDRSTARVNFNSGGYIDLAPNTDPEFRLLREGLCLWMNILFGRVFVETAGRCMDVHAPDFVATIHSQVHLDVNRQRTTVTVIQGTARLFPNSNKTLIVSANEEALVNRGAVQPKRILVRPEIDKITNWRLQIFRNLSPAIRDPAIKLPPAKQPIK